MFAMFEGKKRKNFILWDCSFLVYSSYALERPAQIRGTPGAPLSKGKGRGGNRKGRGRGAPGVLFI